MADPDPVKLTFKGDGVILCAKRTSDGEFIPIVVNNDGSLLASDNGVATQTTLAAILARLSPGSSGPTPATAKTVPTVTAEVVASSMIAARYVRVTSDFANTKTVYVGGSGVTVANGQPLGPGDVYTNSDVDNANLIYCISADAAQILRIEVL